MCRLMGEGSPGSVSQESSVLSPIRLTYLHASLVPIMSKSDDDNTLLFTEDSLINRPPTVYVW